MVNSIKEETGIDGYDVQNVKPVVASAPHQVKTEKKHHTHSKKASSQSLKPEDSPKKAQTQSTNGVKLQQKASNIVSSKEEKKIYGLLFGLITLGIVGLVQTVLARYAKQLDKINNLKSLETNPNAIAMTSQQAEDFIHLMKTN